NDGTLSVTGIETGASVQYSIDGGSSWTDSFTAVEGSNSVQVHQTDLAGNASAAATLAFILDTKAPDAPAVALNFDSGKAGDTITNDGTLSVTGIETNAALAYSTDGGATWASSFTAVEGSNSVQVHQTDLAGNASAAATLAFILDTKAPDAPAVALNFDSGKAGDTITNDGT